MSFRYVSCELQSKDPDEYPRNISATLEQAYPVFLFCKLKKLLTKMVPGLFFTIVMASVIVLFSGGQTVVAQSSLSLTPALEPDPKTYGQWETVIPENDGAAISSVLGMQSVHNVLLPSGKILMISGSSWRNRSAGLNYYPETPQPEGGPGVFVKADNPFEKSKMEEYYSIVNSAGIYDPEKNTFYRIPHPVPVSDPDNSSLFAPNDLFCTGHLHLPDGNILFAGGTQYYTPYRTGVKSTNIFDWKKELATPWPQFDWTKMPEPTSEFYPWQFSGFMERGRWYPQMVPLLDGRVALFSGFVGFDEGYPDPYKFEINHLVEFFDPQRFSTQNPDQAWRSVNVKDLKDSPFATPLEAQNLTAAATRCENQRECDAYKYDAFKLYPHNYLLGDGRIFLTREGDWVSLRYGNTDGISPTDYMRRTQFTYFMEVYGSLDNPKVAFSRGPDRPDFVTAYGTTVRDPNGGQINLFGGQPISPGTLLPAQINDAPEVMEDSRSVNRFVGGRGSRKMEPFHLPSKDNPNGSWSIDPDFLGNSPQDDRTMHYSLILPTKQLLIINGGNYDFYGPVHYPLLLTPKTDEQGNFLGTYDKMRMSDGIEPRLYHSMGILLPDARVLVASGNLARATIHVDEPQANLELTNLDGRSGQPKPNLERVDLDMYFFRDGPMAKGQNGQNIIPTELWVAEIFSPPYLFIDPDRRPVINEIQWQGSNIPEYEPRAEIEDKTFYLIHSKQKYNVKLSELPDQCSSDKGSLVLIKLPSVTHGWDSGQHLVELPFSLVTSTEDTISFIAPDSLAENIPPGFYMMFYVDCRGKPSVAQMVRFDDEANKI